MESRFLAWGTLLWALAGAGPIGFGADDLRVLSDEFNHPGSSVDWSRVSETEGWGFDPLETWDIHGAAPGRLTMIPHSSSWYAEWRGVHAYKAVTGDFVVTTEVEPTSRSGEGAPGSQYSLAGIMVRTPRAMTQGAVDWTPNGQNYIFLSMGSANQPGTYQFEVKTTVNSQSSLEISPGGTLARIQVARIGSVFIVLRQIDDGPWTVHRRYQRADMPATLHVGLTTYTDWPACQAVGFAYHNQNLLQEEVPRLAGGTHTTAPDLMARFDYVRFQRPIVPGALDGRNLADPVEVSDAALLGFLGANANLPFEPLLELKSPAEAEGDRDTADGFGLKVRGETGLDWVVQWSANAVDWQDLQDFTGTGEELEILDASAAGEPWRFYRVVLRP